MKKLKLALAIICGCSLNLQAAEVRQYKAGEVPDANDIARMLGGSGSSMRAQSRPPMRHRGIALISGSAATQQVHNQPAQQAMQQVAVQPQQTASSFALPIQFAINSAKILNSAKPQLNAVAEGLKLIENPLIEIEGHTDLSGSAAYNKRLSRMRAMSVRNYFVSKGLNPNSFIVIGRGSEALINPQNPYAAENRRVEFRAAQ